MTEKNPPDGKGDELVDDERYGDVDYDETLDENGQPFVGGSVDELLDPEDTDD